MSWFHLSLLHIYLLHFNHEIQRLPQTYFLKSSSKKINIKEDKKNRFSS